MELVINIDDEIYEALKSGGIMTRAVSGIRSGKTILSKVCMAVVNGVPLPKGHGDLIDADELKEDYPHDSDWDYPVNSNSYVVWTIDSAQTIIEADKTGSENK